MKKTYRCTNVKFCMEDEVQRRAWEYLHNGECKDGSYGKILSEALIEVLERGKQGSLQSEYKANNIPHETARLVLEGMRELLKETVSANGTAMLMDETMQKQEDDIAEDMLDFAFAMGEQAVPIGYQVGKGTPMFGTDTVPTPIRKTETVELSFVSILVMDLHAEGVQKPRRAPTFDMQCQR